mgnify:CR=1 FL=1
MANIIGTKQYVTALVKNPKTGQVEQRVIKSDSTNSRYVNKLQSNLETAFRRDKKK